MSSSWSLPSESCWCWTHWEYLCVRLSSNPLQTWCLWLGSLWRSCRPTHFTNCQRNSNILTSLTPSTSLPGERFFTSNISFFWVNDQKDSFSRRDRRLTRPHVFVPEAACTSWTRRWDGLQRRTPCSSWSWPGEGCHSDVVCYHGDAVFTQRTVTVLWYSAHVLFWIWFIYRPHLKVHWWKKGEW